MVISDALGLELISRIVGWKLKKGFFGESTPNLPQNIAILAEVNHAFQGTITENVGVEVTSAAEAARLFGPGSPAHIIMRILRPLSGGLVGGIPTKIFPIKAAAGATARQVSIAPTGTATQNGTHYVVIAGRYGLDGGSYAVNIEVGDTPADITAKIADVVNNVYGSPYSAAISSPVTEALLTTKWKGLTAQGATVRMDTGTTNLGVTYAINEEQAGAGTPAVTTALNTFGNTWYPIVINSFGTVTATMDELEAYNGVPDPELPTGRYSGEIWKPFLALTGSVIDNPSTITDGRKAKDTIAICPAPLSEGFPMEAAANMCALFARTSQDTPELDVLGKAYPDMPIALSTIAMDAYVNRDAYVKKGCSTVMLVANQYEVQDFVTTYHPEGEMPPQYRYCRNIMLDMNVRFKYWLLEQQNVVGHVIVNDNDTVNVAKSIKPKEWKALLVGFFEDLESAGLLADSDFSVESLVVGISGTNPDRLETFFKYMRTGVARLSSTTAEAGFNFGKVA